MMAIKGLELQETSCHTVEAGRIDDIFEVTFEKEGGFSFCDWNKYPLNTLRPYDAVIIKTYSDAKNQLTGVIDSPDSLKEISSGFIKTLIWVLVHNIHQRSGNKKTDTDKSSVEKSEIIKLKQGDSDSIHSREELLMKPGNVRNPSKKGSDEGNGSWDASGSWDPEKDPTRPSSSHSRNDPLAQSGRSLPGSLWSDDNDSLLMESLGENKNTMRVNLVSGMSAQRSQDKKEKKSDLPEVETTPIDYGFKDLEFGLPATDINTKNNSLDPLFLKVKPQIKTVQFRNSVDVTQFSTPQSLLLCPPPEWREHAVDGDTLTGLVDLFPKEWYQHVIKGIDLNLANKETAELKEEIAEDKTLMNLYSEVILSCHAIVDVLG